MVIRQQQLELLGAVAMEDFLARADEHVKRYFPDRCPPEDRRVRIQECVVRSRVYGLESEWAVMRYVDMSMALGRAFEEEAEYASVADVLRNMDLNERTKIVRAYAIVNDAEAIADGTLI